MAKEVFISYSSGEFAQADWVRSVLEENGFACWMAPMCIPGGSSYAVEIPNAITACRFFVLILSQKAQASKWVCRELDLAINEDKIVLPFVIEDCKLTPEYRFYLTNVQYYYAYQDRADAMEKLLADMGKPPKSQASAPVAAVPQSKATQLILADGMMYEGEAFAGVPHGYGKGVYKNGDIYEGYWERGKRHGQGTFTIKDDGQWTGEYKDGEPFNGTGLLYIKTGDSTLRYDGQYQNGARNGYGKVWYPDATYEGQWVRGKRHGQGKVIWNQGDEWNGEYRDDKPWTGKGVRYYNDGKLRYEGPYRDGQRNGYGIYRYTDAVYVGEFQNDKRHGQGKINWDKGGHWEGQFRADQQWTGQGRWHFSDAYYEGPWVEGKRQGQGKLVWKQGGQWEGLYRDDKCWNGQGIWRYADSYYDGVIEEGKRNGQGTLVWDRGGRWAGTFKDGNPWNGRGVWYYKEGKREGVFMLGKCVGPELSSYTQPQKTETKDKQQRNGVNIPGIATATLEIGHYKTTLFGKKWVENEPDERGVWNMRCNLRYISEKNARKIALYVVACDPTGKAYEPHRVFLLEKAFFRGQEYQVVWPTCWVGKQVGFVKVIKTNVHFNDGTKQETDYLE